MEELVKIIEEMDIPFAYDHFAEGESPDPPFITYLLPDDDNFAADGKVYYKTYHLLFQKILTMKEKG